MFSGSSRYFVFRKRLCIETPVFFLLILFLCSIPATAADYNIVTADLPPWSTKGTAGIILDIVKEIEKRLGTSNIPHELPWMRAQKNTLENDNYLIFPLTRISSREEDFTWIVDVMPFETVFVTVGSNSVDLETARGLKTILVYQNHPAYHFLVEKGFNNIRVYPYGVTALLKMLANGRADAWFVERSFARNFVIGTPYEGSLVFGPPAVTSRIYIAGSKRISPKIVSAYRGIFDELKKEGFVDKIMIKYLGKEKL